MLRRSEERGYFDFNWLQTYHSFSFSGYHDPRYMGYRSVRVINQDTVQPNSGFPTHPHKDMEILTYVYEGAVAHKDSMGNVTQIKAGEFQIMSAGTGITHSEYNPSSTEKLRLMQIWIIPRERGIAPRYDQKHFSEDYLRNQLRLIVSPDSRDGTMLVNQDALVYTGILEAGKKITQATDPNRYYWLQVVSGNVFANEQELKEGDGLALEKISSLQIQAKGTANLILFDLA